jgi:hypothetical protein
LYINVVEQNCYHLHSHHVIAEGITHKKVFPRLLAGRDIYTFEQLRLVSRQSLLTAVRSCRSAFSEGLERLLPGNPVLLDLEMLALVLLECLLLVLCNKVVDVGSALSGRDVPWRSCVEDPVDIMLAHFLSIRLRFQAYCFRMFLLSSKLFSLPPLHILFARRVKTYSGNLKST